MNTDPRDTIANSPMSWLQIIVVAITVGLNALDGFDVLSISFASPGIAAEWGIDRAALGIVLSMELIGMALGSIFLGGLADKIGRRPTMLGCLVVMAVGMFMVTNVKGLIDLSVWRILTGVGIGGMLAAINAVAAEFSNLKRRDLSVSIMSIGYPIGAVIGGIIVARLLQSHDWRSVFYFGAGITAAFIPARVLAGPGVRALARAQAAARRAREDQSHAPAPGSRGGQQRCRPFRRRCASARSADIFTPGARGDHGARDRCVFLPHHHVLLHREVGAEDRRRHGLCASQRRWRPGVDERRRRDWRGRAGAAHAAIRRQATHDRRDGPVDRHGDRCSGGPRRTCIGWR